MDKKTIEALNALNKKFYSAQAQSFSGTRTFAWSGWRTIGEKLKAKSNKLRMPSNKLKVESKKLETMDWKLDTVLDVGCGNGRFLDFLIEENIEFENYLGIDSSGELLEIAKEKFKKEKGVEFKQINLMDPSQLSIFHFSFSIIAVFGLMHHIPSYEKRLELIISMVERLKVEGCMFITFWQFRKSKRFDKMILGRDDVNLETKKLLDNFEEGDYLLDWDKSGLPRYCHYFSDEELAKLETDLKNEGIKVTNSFSADGKEGNLNRYWRLETPACVEASAGR